MKGLTTEIAKALQERDGKNVLPLKDPVRWQDILMDKIKDPIVQLLILAVVFSIVGALSLKEPLTESYGVLIAIILAVGLAFRNEYSAAKKFEKQNAAAGDYEVPCYRDGILVLVKKSDLVVGDVIVIENGLEAPADCIVIEGEGQFNESAVTGENVPVIKTINANSKEVHTYNENFIVGSTPIVSGRVVAQVTQIGSNTEAGKINNVLQTEDEKSPLEKELDSLAELIAKLAFGAAGIMYVVLNVLHMIKAGHIDIFNIVFAVSLVVLISPVIRDTYSEKEFNKGKMAALSILLFGFMNVFGIFELGATQFLVNIKDILHVFMGALTLIVVAIPEGLPLAITLSLSYAMKIMLGDNVLIKKLNACETLGAINIICTDKTGTLTQNIMEAQEVVTKGLVARHELSFLDSFARNSTAEGEVGNPTEIGIIKYFGNNAVLEARNKAKDALVEMIPFNSTIKRSYAIYKTDSPNVYVAYCKGAPEIVLSQCEYAISKTNINDIEDNPFEFEVVNSDYKEQMENTLAVGQQQGLRAIGLAYAYFHGEVPSSIEEIVAFNKFTFQGYVTIKDPIRPDVPKAMDAAKNMGIDVKIVTGDNKNTAMGIGSECGLVNLQFPKDVYEGDQVYTLPTSVIKYLKVLARSKPMDKLKLVDTLHSADKNSCIAVTGDGTNDAPAMKASECGVSMGNATSIAKNTADVILLDNSFASLIKGIIWGRSIYRNIRKFIMFQLSINVSAVLSTILCPLLGMEAPFTIIQMLWINIIMDTLAALAFASNNPTKDLETKQPRSITEGIISKPMYNYILTTGVVQTIAVLLMSQILKDPSITFTAFILMQIFNMLAVNKYDTKLTKEDKTNYSFYGILAVIIVVQIIASTFLHEIFGIDVLNLRQWSLSIVLAFITFLMSTIVNKLRK